MHIGLLLAGGRSRRMGGTDKLLWLIDRAAVRLLPQVDRLVLSANGNLDDLLKPDLPAVEDGPVARRGPLAGILAGLRWGRVVAGKEAVVFSVPSDTPFFPLDLATRLSAAREAEHVEVAVAASEDRVQHAIAAWPVVIADDLEAWLTSASSIAMRVFLALKSSVTVSFDAAFDPVFNINTPNDLQHAVAIEAAFVP